MRNIYSRLFFLFLCIFFMGCTSFSKQSMAAYYKDVYPLIIEQLNNTALMFFYDIEKANERIEGSGLPFFNYPVKNVVLGEDEIEGVCTDYTIHFMENYKGLGNVYLVSTERENAYLYTLQKNGDETLFLMEEIIPTPKSHAGRKTGYFNHAWVRIIYNGITIDVEPTWYDSGLSQKNAVKVIK